jgi:hypothetical protein
MGIYIYINSFAKLSIRVHTRVNAYNSDHQIPAIPLGLKNMIFDLNKGFFMGPKKWPKIFRFL